eukprot:scpid113580/ scgid22970/ 
MLLNGQPALALVCVRVSRWKHIRVDALGLCLGCVLRCQDFSSAADCTAVSHAKLLHALTHHQLYVFPRLKLSRYPILPGGIITMVNVYYYGCFNVWLHVCVCV